MLQERGWRLVVADSPGFVGLQPADYPVSLEAEFMVKIFDRSRNNKLVAFISYSVSILKTSPTKNSARRNTAMVDNSYPGRPYPPLW